MSRKKSILTKYYQPLRGSVDDDKRTGHRIYRLKGYTTVDKINRKFAQERYQRTLRNTLTFIMIVILLVILFVIYNPFTDVGELKKITGEDSYFKQRQTTETNGAEVQFP